MFIGREDVQPALDKLVHVYTKDEQEYDARFLIGDKSYEGWYIPSLKKIMSQKELKVDMFENAKGRLFGYMPRKELDFVFSRRKFMPQEDFAEEVMRYVLEIED